MNILHGRFVALARSLQGVGFVPIRYKKQRVNHDYTIFLYYPPTEKVARAPEHYENVREFFYYHKRGQLRVLSEHFDVPTDHEDCDPPWVVRPVYHFGGQHFHVVNNERELRAATNEIAQSSNENRWYASRLFRRTREFRSFFVGGEHIVTMLKRMEGVGYAEAENMPDIDNDNLQQSAWNRCETGETQYLTINRDRNNKLLDTTFFEDAASFFEDRPFDFLAIDTGYNDESNEYRVFEANFAPQLTVGSALEPIAAALRDLRGVGCDA